MDNADVVLKPVKDFGKNSIRLVKRCTKPDRKGAARWGWPRGQRKTRPWRRAVAPSRLPGMSLSTGRRRLGQAGRAARRLAT